MEDNDIRIFAFYLPQFHPFKENDEWWGKGFTEWTNVAKALPLYKGHLQPKIPADLGFYDLRLSETREQQAKLAKTAGVEAFCYYHYWFDGKEIMEKPMKDMVATKKPKFPFFVCWANETWYNKMWNKEGSIISKKVLIEQTYPGTKDNEAHFYNLLSAFKDERYVRIDGKLAFMIYRPLNFPNVCDFMNEWQILAQKNGLPSFYFMGQAENMQDLKKQLKMGFDSVNLVRLRGVVEKPRSLKQKICRAYEKLLNYPRRYNYKDILEDLVGTEEYDEKINPTIIPNWDHTPRSGKNGWVIHKSTPNLFRKHVSSVLDVVKNKKNKIVFLKSWNEWGEGNYMEPDQFYGSDYIHALRDIFDKYKK